jgi:hypothetical protein
MKRSPADDVIRRGDDDTGLPWVRSWNGVYLIVFISFILWVAMLVALTDFFP